MIIKFNKAFIKQVKNLKPAQQKRLGHRSISFGGDWRAHFKMIDAETALFVAVGTHSQLYK